MKEIAILQPGNPALPPLILDGDTEVKIYGAVRAIHSKL